MAIIKCPECGHQVSDKAPTCPSCGVEIAGNINHCPQCGAVYLKDQDVCPYCHHPSQRPVQVQQHVAPPPVPQQQRPPMQKAAETEAPKKKGFNWTALLIAFLMAATICGVCFYFYHTAKDTKETEAYDYAMTSNDPLVMQSFLDTYRDADAQKRQNITNRLAAIRQADADWTNACLSKSKSALEAFLAKYPDTPHKGEVQNKIDSIDWSVAKAAATIEAYQHYIELHPNGARVAEANEEINNLNTKTILPEEREIVVSTLRKFFQSINKQNEQMLRETLTELLPSFQGRSNVTKEDVVAFMHRQWKADVKNINWHLLGDYDIEKDEIGTGRFEYNVKCNARQDLERVDDTKSSQRYHIMARINDDAQLIELNMNKIVE